MSVLRDFICASIQGRVSCCLNATIIHHMKLISPKKDQHGFIFQLTQVCAAHRSQYGLYLLLPPLLSYIYPIYGPVPEEQRCDVSHILGASAPSDKPPSVPLSAGGCTQGALVSDYSHFSTFRLPLKSIIPCNKPFLPNRLTQGEHIFSFPATMCNGSILCNQEQQDEGAQHRKDRN